MRVQFDLPFRCPENMIGHLQKVLSGEYEIPAHYANPPVVIDLGANSGAFSLWASHRWPGCEVWAYEPQPAVFEVLRTNLMHYPNVKPHNYALGKPGMRVLYDGTHNDGEASFHTMSNNSLGTGQHFEVKDPLELPHAQILKLDIEGCEGEVLERLIKKDRVFDYIMLEIHSEELRRLVDLLLWDYALIGSVTEHMAGRHVFRYMHKEIHNKMFGGMR